MKVLKLLPTHEQTRNSLKIEESFHSRKYALLCACHMEIFGYSYRYNKDKTLEVWVQGSAVRVQKLHNLEAKKVTKIQGNFKCCQYFLQQTLISRKLKNIKRMNKNTIITN